MVRHGLRVVRDTSPVGNAALVPVQVVFYFLPYISQS